MNNQLLAVVQHIESERGVSREIVLTAIEQAIMQAARKSRDVTNDLRVVINRNDLSLHIYDTFVASDEETGPGFLPLARARRIKPDIKEGDAIEIELPPARLGRIAAQTSRQMIMQKIRDAERTLTFSEYRDRQGDIVTGTVSAIVRRDVYVMVGKTEMLLPAKEKIPSENYQVGDTIKAIILKVEQDARGPSVTLSRSHPKFLEALFRLEVSEIAKVAVRTSNENVDPVGACVGQKGTRVRAIVNALGGEKIDIVRWNEDICQFVAQALAPAKLESITVDPAQPNTVHVTVAPDQYSLALGKHGQNVKLTSRLVGWNIEVKKSMASASFEDQKAEAIKELAETLSVSTADATQMAEAGFLSVEGIVGEDEATFIAMTGLDEVTAKGIYAAALAVADLLGVKVGKEEPESVSDEELMYGEGENSPSNDAE